MKKATWKKAVAIIALTCFACGVMAIIDAVIQPGYLVKSLIKIVLFLIIPFLYSIWDKELQLKKLFIPQKKGLIKAFLMGIGVYLVIIGAYFLFRNVFDFSSLTNSLTESTGVSRENFLFVAIYISFANSLLEEFFFRGFGFICAKRNMPRALAYVISSLAFAAYHIAMMIGWFDWPVVLLALIGLFLGGMIFNYFNEKYENIYLSWLIHMFANFAINTIGFILFNAN